MQSARRTVMARIPLLLAFSLLALTVGTLAQGSGAPPASADGARQNIENMLREVGRQRTEYDPVPTPQFPFGVYTISATVENPTDLRFRDIELIGVSITGGNLGLDCEGGVPMGAGCVVRAPDEALGDDGILSPGERFDMSVSIGLKSPLPFTVEYEVWATVLDEEEPEEPVNGVLLEGEAGSPAIAALTTFDTGEGVPQDEISVDDAGAEVARTQFEVAFFNDATVEQVNDLLESVDGRIVSMLSGVTIVVVGIPDPGTLEGLDAVIAQVEASPIVRYVNKSYFAEPEALPPNIPPDPAVMVAIQNHLAVGAHGAWNAQSALSGPQTAAPDIVVADFFGGGNPTGFPVTPLGGTFGTGAVDDHGYHVMGIIGAGFGGADNARGYVTGIHPSATRLTGIDIVVDATTRLTESQIQNRMIDAIRNSTRNVVVNTSLSFPCNNTAPATQFCNVTYANQSAVTWIEKVRGSESQSASNIEGKFVHVTAAGNIHPAVPDNTDAAVNSSWTAAKLLPGLQSPGVSGPEAVASLTNTLVVENAAVGTAGPLPYRTACLANSSKYRGDIAAIGTDVWSYTDAATSAGFLTGTSMASPQVAGLAAFVWQLDPSLTPQQVIEIIESTARADLNFGLDNPQCNTSVLPAPVIDAYAAVLATDNGIGDAPVRLAILDVAGTDETSGTNGQFDEDDVWLFLQELQASAGATVDYSRYDLNGDGYTGGQGAHRFDLDVNSPPAFTTIEAEIDSTEMEFDETQVTDVEALCYYAYSPLYTGDEIERDELLGAECNLWQLQGFVASAVGQSGCGGASFWPTVVNEPQPAFPLTFASQCPNATIQGTLSQPDGSTMALDAVAAGQYPGCTPAPECGPFNVLSAGAGALLSITVDTAGTFHIELEDPAVWVTNISSGQLQYALSLVDTVNGTILINKICNAFPGLNGCYSPGDVAFQPGPVAVDIPVGPGQYQVSMSLTVSCVGSGNPCDVSGEGRVSSITFTPLPETP